MWKRWCFQAKLHTFVFLGSVCWVSPQNLIVYSTAFMIPGSNFFSENLLKMLSAVSFVLHCSSNPDIYIRLIWWKSALRPLNLSNWELNPWLCLRGMQCRESDSQNGKFQKFQVQISEDELAERDLRQCAMCSSTYYVETKLWWVWRESSCKLDGARPFCGVDWISPRWRGGIWTRSQHLSLSWHHQPMSFFQRTLILVARSTRLSAVVVVDSFRLKSLT